MGHPCPDAAGLREVPAHHLSVIIVVEGDEAPGVFKNLHPFQLLSVRLEFCVYRATEESENAFRCSLAACMALHVFVAW